jgi:hypothetical protein
MSATATETTTTTTTVIDNNKCKSVVKSTKETAENLYDIIEVGPPISVRSPFETEVTHSPVFDLTSKGPLLKLGPIVSSKVVPDLVVHPNYSRFAPFDLVFFSRDRDDPVTHTIQVLSEKHFKVNNKIVWSHVGILIPARLFPNLMVPKSDISADRLYIWESTLSSNNQLLNPLENVPDIFGQYKFGVQLRDFGAILAACDDNNISIGYVRLREEIARSLVADEISLRTVLTNIYTKYSNHSYEYNPLYLAGAFMQRCACMHNKEKRVFSSQFVTIVLKNLGLIPKNIISSAMLPIELALPGLCDDEEFQAIAPKVFMPLQIISIPGPISADAARKLRKKTTQLYTRYMKIAIKWSMRLVISLIHKSKILKEHNADVMFTNMVYQ